MTVRHRRFMLLAVALVALNSFFWLAGGGLALPKSIINNFFGNRMVRAEVIVQTGAGASQDWRIDRGVITAVAGTTVTLLEADGTSQTIQIDPAAKVQGLLRVNSVAKLRPRVRVVLYHQANQAAELVQVEGVGG